MCSFPSSLASWVVSFLGALRRAREATMPTPRRRPCRFCRRWFRPDARLGKRQYACCDRHCQAERQARNQASWLSRHPGSFHGREAKHRAWRAEHPDAQPLWRAQHPGACGRDRLARAERRRTAPLRRAVEQEARALQLVVRQEDGCGVPRAVEQESMAAQALVLVAVASRLSPAVEQESISGALSWWHLLGRRLVGGAPRHEPAKAPAG